MLLIWGQWSCTCTDSLFPLMNQSKHARPDLEGDSLEGTWCQAMRLELQSWIVLHPLNLDWPRSQTAGETKGICAGSFITISVAEGFLREWVQLSQGIRYRPQSLASFTAVLDSFHAFLQVQCYRQL